MNTLKTRKKTMPLPNAGKKLPHKEKTAFVFSGGGARGAYQVGVWQGLREIGLSPDIVTGTSVGAINAALVVQDSFDLAFHLWKQLDTDMVFDLEQMQPDSRALPFEFDIKGLSLEELSAYAKGFLTQGGVGNSALETMLREYIDEKRFRRSPIDYGLVTVELPSFKPHYLYKEQIPMGKLIPYILASASCYPVVKAHEIDGIKYIDGGYADNLPVQMALDRGAEYIIAADLNAIGVIHEEAWKDLPHFRLIRSHWDLGNFLVFDENNAGRIMNLGYFDCLKNFGFFDGSLYCMAKGNFPSRLLHSAEQAGRFFEIDPTVLYTKESFNRRLKEAISLQTHSMKKEIRTLKRNLANPSKALESLSDLLKQINGAALVLFLAAHLRENPDSQKFFSRRAVHKLIGDELAAARYLLAAGLPLGSLED